MARRRRRRFLTSGRVTRRLVRSGRQSRRRSLRPRASVRVRGAFLKTGVPRGQGFRLSVFGAHNSEVAGLIGLARAQAEKEIGRQYLEASSHRPGWMLRDEEVAGRLVWSGEGPYDVVVACGDNAGDAGRRMAQVGR